MAIAVTDVSVALINRRSEIASRQLNHRDDCKGICAAGIVASQRMPSSADAIDRNESVYEKVTLGIDELSSNARVRVVLAIGHRNRGNGLRKRPNDCVETRARRIRCNRGG
ncbi:MAG: hypothetical protein ABSF34_10390, partial [Verrucomicrobiota bacterium]